MILIGRTLSVVTPPTGVGASVEVVSASVTVLAALAAGVWAYFKFLKGRTYRPRLEVMLQGQWLRADERALLVISASVKNIGLSKVSLRQYGTGLKVRRLTDTQPVPPDVMSWEEVTSTPTYEILRDHEWFEPGETVRDELLIDLDVKHPVVILVESRLVCKLYRGRRNIAVLTRKIVVPETLIWNDRGEA